MAVSNKSENNGLFESISTGLTDLDKIIGGLPLGELIIIGARPAMGKTALLVSIMANSINNKNEPIAYFSMENSAQTIMFRLISLTSEILHNKLVSKHLEPYEINLILDKTKKLGEANITIEDITDAKWLATTDFQKVYRNTFKSIEEVMKALKTT